MPATGINTTYPSLLTGDGTCSGNCNPYEFATWNVGTLAPGASVTVTMPMVVTNGTSYGRLIVVDADVGDDNLDLAVASATTMVGTTVDAPPPYKANADFDGSSVVNFGDLAAFKAHFGGSDPRYDLNGDGTVNFGDLAIFKSLFGM